MTIKSTLKVLFVFCIILLVIAWFAWIFTSLYCGYDFDKVYASVLNGTLILMLWMMIRRNETLIEEKEEWRRAYNDLLNNVLDHISKGKDLSDIKRQPERKSYFDNLDC